MSSVTIRGSIMPCGFLPRGEERTVQRTPFVERLIEQGFVDVIAGCEIDHVVAAQAEPEALTDKIVSGDPTPHTFDNPPARNASREDWAEFLAARTNIVTEDKNRAELQAEWDEYSAPDILGN